MIIYNSTSELDLDEPFNKSDSILAQLVCKEKALNESQAPFRENATRKCLSNGTWDRSDYSKCYPITSEELIRDIWNARDASMIYYFGYGLSLLALTLALFIFLYCKDLRGIRYTIHTNLMVTYELFALTWITTASLQLNQSSNESISRVVCFLYILLPYFTGTKFFWMFIEGLYLYILVVKTFSTENIKLHLYCLIGWGLPGLIVLVWAPTKYLFGKSSENNHGESTHSLSSFKYNCPWQAEDSFDIIFTAPILLVLMINIYFLCRIMWVLITKLRAETSTESRQYWKAAKALLVLTPLLGVAYTLLLVTPSSGPAKTVILFLQATLYSTQGFSVSVLYCFLNGEVRKSIKLHFERWLAVRTLTSDSSPPGRRSICFKKLSGSSVDSDRGSIRKTSERITNDGDILKKKQVYFAHFVNDEACRKNLLFNCSKSHQIKCIDEEAM